MPSVVVMDRFSTIYHLRLREDPSFSCPVAEGMELRIGRDPGNSLQLSHRSIAPFHCRVRNERGALKLEPLGQPAVYVDARKIRGALTLSGRERVRIGDIELYFEKQLHDLGLVRPVAARNGRSRPLRWMRYAAWILVSLVAHAFALAFLGVIPFGLAKPVVVEREIVTTLTLAPRRTEPELPKLDGMPRIEHDPVAETLSPLAAPSDVSQMPELWQAPLVAEVDGNADPNDVAPGRLAGEPGGIIGVGPGGRGSGGAGHNLAGRPRLRRETAAKNPLQRFLQGVRLQGMDLVFVIDTTISMDSVLGRAKQTADRMVHLLSELVDDLRVGVVAYRDEHDAYVTISSPLDANLYRTLCFLHDLEATGGGDFEEAVDRGLAAACKLEWRPQARRVILLIADAPTRPAATNDLLRQVSAFASPALPNRGEAVVASMFVVSLDRTTQENRAKIADFFRSVARAGHGDFLELQEADPIGQELLVLALGERFRDDLLHAQEGSSQVDVKSRVIARHLARNDRPWFLRALGRTPVLPEVVDAVLLLKDRRTLERVVDLAVDEHRHPASRFAALYILKQASGARLSFDPTRPTADQKAASEALRGVARAFP